MVLSLQFDLLLVMLCALGGLVEGRRLRRLFPEITLETDLKRSSLLSVALPLSVIILLVTLSLAGIRKARPSLFWSMPIWLEYHVEAVSWASVLALFSFTFSTISTIAVKSGHPKKGRVVLASVLFIATVITAQWSYTHPIAEQLEEEVSSSGMVYQTSPVSCAAASGATILRMLGFERTEKEVAEVFGTSMLGTSAAQVVYGMARLGFVARKVEVPGADPGKLNPPAMLWVDNPVLGPESHAVAFLDFRHEVSRVWDPLVGMRNLERKAMELFWRGRGVEIRRAGLGQD